MSESTVNQWLCLTGTHHLTALNTGVQLALGQCGPATAVIPPPLCIHMPIHRNGIFLIYRLRSVSLSA